jgi:hypothetical protein
LCITVALVPIVALFLGGDALGFVEFGEKVHLAGDLGPAPGAAGAASPYCLVALGTAAAVEGFRGAQDGDSFLGGFG